MVSVIDSSVTNLMLTNTVSIDFVRNISYKSCSQRIITVSFVELF